jgi:hypothetical protein
VPKKSSVKSQTEICVHKKLSMCGHGKRRKKWNLIEWDNKRKFSFFVPKGIQANKQICHDTIDKKRRISLEVSRKESRPTYSPRVFCAFCRLPQIIRFWKGCFEHQTSPPNAILSFTRKTKFSLVQSSHFAE